MACRRFRSALRAGSASESQLEFIGEFEVWVVRRNVKNISLYVKQPDARIEVHAHPRVSMAAIEELVLSKREWIIRKQQEILNSPLSRADSASAEEIEEWRAAVKAAAPALVAVWEKRLGVKAGQLAYRNMKTRWGSCQPSTGRICLNIRLALYPPECLEYVVVHELCHLIVPGHGQEFHALMDTVLPDWRARRNRLRGTV